MAHKASPLYCQFVNQHSERPAAAAETVILLCDAEGQGACGPTRSCKRKRGRNTSYSLEMALEKKQIPVTCLDTDEP